MLLTRACWYDTSNQIYLESEWESMNKVKVCLDSCFGICHMEHEFDFTNSNVIALYARNGLMKTSFAKIFKKVQDGKADEIKDEIFNLPGTLHIECDGSDIDPSSIFVVKSFESAYEADITPLLIKQTVKEQLKAVLKARDKLFKALEKNSGLKVKKTLAGKVIYELEPKLIEDLRFDESSFLVNVLSIRDMHPAQDFSQIIYNDLFDATVLKKILSSEFQDKIREFVASSEEIYASYEFLEKGQLTLPKLKDIRKSLEKDKFFVRGNGVHLSGTAQISDIHSLEQKIAEIDEQIRAVPQFQAIEQMLSDAKGTILKDIVETCPELIAWLTARRLPELKKELWYSYFFVNADLVSDLCNKYEALSREIDAVSLDDTPWKRALEIYKKRFDVPFEMEITNLKGAIIGESIPRVEFSFSRDGQTVTLSRDKLDELDTLSQGEKRALYLLNIIFEIEEIKQNGQEKLLIVDDIADSFDYKNKYAIIEYLYELAEDNLFSMIIMSHNFDFYRTVSSRLGLRRDCRLFVDGSDGNITLVPEYYQNQPFEIWKEHPIEKNIIALVPFVRNLVEYGRDYHTADPNGPNTDFNLLTMLLHEKEQTHNMRFSDLVSIYNTYLGLVEFDATVNLQGRVVDTLYSICDVLTSADTNLENKIVLAMAIRHKAEEFMKREIQAYEGTITWRGARRTPESGSSIRFLEAISSKKNQTRELLNGYKQFGEESKIKTLEEVNIMTPENIHLNSFMYEPILDMDVNELLSLYGAIKRLAEENVEA